MTDSEKKAAHCGECKKKTLTLCRQRSTHSWICADCYINSYCDPYPYMMVSGTVMFESEFEKQEKEAA